MSVTKNGQGFSFINPYNFIPAGKKRPAGKSRDEKTYSGVIEYSLLTKSPLFLPNTSNDDYYRLMIEQKEDPSGDNEKSGELQHKSYDFYSYHDLTGKHGTVLEKQGMKTDAAPNYEPVIPGSSVRGMFRSNYEILTNSCMSGLSEEPQRKRTMASFKSGLIRREVKGGKVCYTLCEAEDVLWRTKGENDTEDEKDWKKDGNAYKTVFFGRKCFVQDDFPEGVKVCYTPIPRGKAKTLATDVKQEINSKRREGYIIKGMKGPDFDEPENKSGLPPAQKHCCHIFSLRTGSSGFTSELTDKNLDKLKALLKIFDQNITGAYKEYSEQLKKFIDGKSVEKYFPVYYTTFEQSSEKRTQRESAPKVMLSPACKTRELYDVSIQDLAEKMGVGQCDDPEKLCEACALFGTVAQGADGAFARASKLRFTDLTLEKNSEEWELENPYQKCYYPYGVTLPPLSSPKTSATEFYLQRPNDDAMFWSYEYYVTKKHQVISAVGTLAGRKFYWHNCKAAEELCENAKDNGKRETRTGQNITIHLLRSGCYFRGKVYFDKISETQLQQLIYVIQAGDAGELEEKAHGYKLGTAKPLGFGSVACKVDAVRLKEYDFEEGMIRRKADCKWTLEKQDGLDEKFAVWFSSGKTIVSEDETATAREGDSLETLRGDFAKMTAFDALEKLKKTYTYSYPRETESGEIFKWFQGNRIGIDQKKKREISSPNQREDLCFRQYMEPMDPKLHAVNALESTSAAPERSDGVFEGIVKGYFEKGNIAMKAKVQCADGGNVCLHVKVVKSYLRQIGALGNQKNIDLTQYLSIGDKVRIQCDGKDENGYPVYTLLQIKKSKRSKIKKNAEDTEKWNIARRN